MVTTYLQGIAKSPNEYGPMIIYLFGRKGLGKASLLHAFAAEAMAQNPTLRVARFTAETWNGMFSRLNANRAGKEEFWTDTFRSWDIVLLEDVDQLQTASSEIHDDLMLAMFNVTQYSKTIFLVSGNKHPYRLTGFHDRVTSRLLSGTAWKI